MEKRPDKKSILIHDFTDYMVECLKSESNRHKKYLIYMYSLFCLSNYDIIPYPKLISSSLDN